jgi:putative phage-type endonuclease
MNKLKDKFEDKLKDILQNDYVDCFYEEHQLSVVFNDILVKLKIKNTKEVANQVATNTHFSKQNSKYYFNVLKNQVKRKDDIVTFLLNEKQEVKEDVKEEEIKDLNNKNMFSKYTPRQKVVIKEEYKYPTDSPYTIIKYKTPEYAPFNKQSIYDVQTDDVYDKTLELRALQYDKLRAIKIPAQRSKEWYEMRGGAATASDSGTILGVNKYEPQFKFLLKKCIKETPFISNAACYHGKKFESIATLIYSTRNNVTVEDFGLLIHPKYSFIAASPDGISSRVKYDKTTKSSSVGKMLEIKVPATRKIKTTGEINGDICLPAYYSQVQMQLETANLDACDFWQCTITEYANRQEFIKDTNSKEPFRSLETTFEKGCLLQLIHKSKVQLAYSSQTKYNEVIYEDTQFIYPPKLHMTPLETDIWIAESIQDININSKHKDYVFDKVIYWRLEKSHNVTIERDRNWFKESLPIFKKTWDQVLYFRDQKNLYKIQLLYKYLNLTGLIDTKSTKEVTQVLEIIEKLHQDTQPGYKEYLEQFEKDVNVLIQDNKELDANIDKLEEETEVKIQETEVEIQEVVKLETKVENKDFKDNYTKYKTNKQEKRTTSRYSYADDSD